MVIPVFRMRRQTVGLVCPRETVGFVYGSRAKMGSITSVVFRESLGLGRRGSLALAADLS